MTQAERQRANEALYFRRLRERNPKWLRLVERWDALWAKAQIAADERARARSNADDKGGSD